MDPSGLGLLQASLTVVTTVKKARNILSFPCPFPQDPPLHTAVDSLFFSLAPFGFDIALEDFFFFF